MQSRYLAWIMSSLLLVVSAATCAEEQVKRTADQIVNTVCAACHAPDGNSVVTLNPKLAGQHPEYLAKQLTEYKSGKRANAVMSGMAAGPRGRRDGPTGPPGARCPHERVASRGGACLSRRQERMFTVVRPRFVHPQHPFAA